MIASIPVIAIFHFALYLNLHTEPSSHDFLIHIDFRDQNKSLDREMYFLSNNLNTCRESAFWGLWRLYVMFPDEGLTIQDHASSFTVIVRL